MNTKKKAPGLPSEGDAHQEEQYFRFGWIDTEGEAVEKVPREERLQTLEKRWSLLVEISANAFSNAKVEAEINTTNDPIDSEREAYDRYERVEGLLEVTKGDIDAVQAEIYGPGGQS